MNLVTTHSNCTSPMDYIPIMHCTHTFPSTITPITQLSPFTSLVLIVSHTCTSFTHTHLSSTLTCTHCEVLFLPRLTFLSVLPGILIFRVRPRTVYLTLWFSAACPCDLISGLSTTSPVCRLPDLSLVFVYELILSPLPLSLVSDLCLFNIVSNKSCKWIPMPQTVCYRFILMNLYYIIILMRLIIN